MQRMIAVMALLLSLGAPMSASAQKIGTAADIAAAIPSGRYMQIVPVGGVTVSDVRFECKPGRGDYIVALPILALGWEGCYEVTNETFEEKNDVTTRNNTALFTIFQDQRTLSFAYTRSTTQCAALPAAEVEACDQELRDLSHAFGQPSEAAERVLKAVGIEQRSYESLTAGPFADVSQLHPYADAIKFLKDNTIVQGYPDGTFKPDAPINRAEFVKIIMEGIGQKFRAPLQTLGDPKPSHMFKDVSKDDWFYSYVLRAKGRIVDGYPDDTFRPANNINFVEAAKIIVSAASEVDEYALQEALVENPEPWYLNYVFLLQEYGSIPLSIVSFESPITRGEMAEIMYRIMKKNYGKPSQGYFDLMLESPTRFDYLQQGMKFGGMRVQSFEVSRTAGYGFSWEIPKVLLKGHASFPAQYINYYRSAREAPAEELGETCYNIVLHPDPSAYGAFPYLDIVPTNPDPNVTVKEDFVVRTGRSDDTINIVVQNCRETLGMLPLGTKGAARFTVSAMTLQTNRTQIKVEAVTDAVVEGLAGPAPDPPGLIRYLKE